MQPICTCSVKRLRHTQCEVEEKGFFRKCATACCTLFSQIQRLVLGRPKIVKSNKGLPFVPLKNTLTFSRMSGRGRRSRAGVAPLEEGNEATAASMIGQMRHVEDTLKGYNSKVKNMTVFILSRPDLHEALDGENKLDPAAITHRILNELFSWLATNTDLPRDSKRSAARTEAVIDVEGDIFEISKNLPTVAVSTMQGSLRVRTPRLMEGSKYFQRDGTDPFGCTCSIYAENASKLSRFYYSPQHH